MPEAGTLLRGTPVSGGLAVGRLHVVRAADAAHRHAGTPEEELAAFRAALGAARADIELLLAAEDDLAGGILEFQAALLEDDDLITPIADAVARGAPAHAAWTAAIDREIADYRGSGEAGGDDVLAARADDLADLKGRVLAHLTGGAHHTAAVPDGAIVIARDLTPSAFLTLDWSRIAGAATVGGSPTSHVAILARARGVSLVVGLDAVPEHLPEGETAILDAATGTLDVAPSAAALASARDTLAAAAADRAVIAAAARAPAATADGAPVTVLVNIDDPAILDALAPDTCDGVGLTRTEFLFGKDLPDEEAQLAFYRRLLAWAAGRPVTIRTLDAGGDKPVPGLTLREDNPFLGVRGVRLSLARPEVFRVQLRAIARAAAGAAGRLKVMVPMVTVPAELAAVRAMLSAEVLALRIAGVAAAMPPVGMMLEVPAAALTAEAFDADFYSIGSNDLIQYATASARDNAAVATLADPRNPAIAELIARTVAAGAKRGVDVSLCGDMASSPDLAAVLLAAGVRTFSVAPAQVGAVKQAIAAARLTGAADG
jgi:phosphotransferase system enzyme I (PtsI)